MFSHWIQSQLPCFFGFGVDVKPTRKLFYQRPFIVGFLLTYQWAVIFFFNKNSWYVGISHHVVVHMVHQQVALSTTVNKVEENLPKTWRLFISYFLDYKNAYTQQHHCMRVQTPKNSKNRRIYTYFTSQFKTTTSRKKNNDTLKRLSWLSLTNNGGNIVKQNFYFILYYFI